MTDNHVENVSCHWQDEALHELRDTVRVTSLIEIVLCGFDQPLEVIEIGIPVCQWILRSRASPDSSRVWRRVGCGGEGVGEGLDFG